MIKKAALGLLLLLSLAPLSTKALDRCLIESTSILNISPQAFEGNDNKVEYEGLQSIKQDPTSAFSSYDLLDGKISVQIDGKDQGLSISVNDPSIEVEYVHVKGGDSYNVYDYTAPGHLSGEGVDEFLYSPCKKNLPAISHFTVFYKETVVKPPVNIVGDVSIEKTSSQTGRPLSGASFGLFHEDGTFIAEGVTDEIGILSFYDLAEGNYYLQELSAPEGYVLNGEKIPFTISEESGLSIKLTFQNDPIITPPSYGELTIYKIDGETKESLQGAVFQLTNVCGDIIFDRLVTDENGEIRVSNLQKGSYVLTEIESPDGYLFNDKTISFTVDEENKIFEFTVENFKEEVTVPPTDPEVPVVPETPETPVTPETPIVPPVTEDPKEEVEQPQEATKTETQTTIDKLVETGLASDLILIFGSLLIAIGGYFIVKKGNE